MSRRIDPLITGDGRRHVRILAIADVVSPFVYSQNFPDNLPPFDLVVCAGDMPGHVLEFLATKLVVQPVYVLGNHHNAFLRDAASDEVRLPGGCINAHGRVFEHGGVRFAGIEGSLRYRPGPHQYSDLEMSWMTMKLAPRLLANRWRDGRAVDVLLTHAAPKGPHEGEDHPHRGVAAFNRFHRMWNPRVHIHGHVHLSGANAAREYVSEDGVRVVNAFEFTIVDVDLGPEDDDAERSDLADRPKRPDAARDAAHPSAAPAVPRIGGRHGAHGGARGSSPDAATTGAATSSERHRPSRADDVPSQGERDAGHDA